VVTVKALLTVTEKARLAVWLVESVTVAVKAAVPRVGEAPETIPPPDRLKPMAARLFVPAGLVDQVLPPEPPVAAIVSE
jgi:hypothetical protein